MYKYETLFVLHPEQGEAQVKETIERTRKLIESMQGTIDEVQEWGMRELAYPIRKNYRGIYTLLRYTSRPEVVQEVERNFKIVDEVLRFVSVRMPEPKKVDRRTRKKQAAAAARAAAAPAPAAQEAAPQGE